MATNQDMIRAYMLRCIKEKNGEFSRIINSAVKSGNCNFNTKFNEALQFFAGGKNAEPLNLILEYNKKEGKHLPAYQFFDIDTLISYNGYLELLISKIRAEKTKNRHVVASIGDVDAGMDATKKIVIDMKYKSGADNFVYGNEDDRKLLEHYNHARPITLMYKSGKLNPEKPMTDTAFDKKYNIDDCVREVELYKKEKSTGQTSQTPQTLQVSKAPQEQVKSTQKRGEVAKMVAEKQKSNTSKYIDLGYMDFKYKGNLLKLHINKREFFTDIQGRGIVRIDAENEYGRLFGCYYNDGRVYNGDLYDRDGEVAEVDGGGVMFYPSKNKPLEDKSLIETDDQLRLF